MSTHQNLSGSNVDPSESHCISWEAGQKNGIDPRATLKGVPLCGFLVMFTDLPSPPRQSEGMLVLGAEKRCRPV